MKSIFLSVILPVYNAEAYIVEAISSILAQTYENFELIIINDGSTDQTEALIKNFRDARILYYSRENRGVNASRNEAFRLARGEYIALQDADDISNPTRFEKQIQFLETHRDYVVVGSLAEVIDEQGQYKSDLLRPITKEQIMIYHIFETPFINGSGMFRRSIVDSGIFYLNIFPAGDYEFWTRVLRLGYGFNIPEKLYSYREHTRSISCTLSSRQIDNAQRIRTAVQSRLLANEEFTSYASFKSFFSDNPVFSDWERGHYQNLAYHYALKLLSIDGSKAKEEYIIANEFARLSWKERVHFCLKLFASSVSHWRISPQVLARHST